ncbi:MAG TPA: competence/damage-inducible protein A [Bryobacteraceae bacterium]|jgi:nicotinamide-nucleotide amidase|nr:competence/damage-inducible protein A [Bryobacteraceae bacterium]
MANAEIIAIGSELLTPQRIDTNSLTITEQLNAIGVEVHRKQVIGDDRARLTEAIREALNRVDIVILSGGLGPTEDDVTRDAAAAALGRSLVHSLEQEAILQARFDRLRRKMAENNRRQTYLVEGAEAVPNGNGTAPGQFIQAGEKILILLPGPPRELKPMVINEIIPRLKPLLPKEVIKVRSFRITGMGESDLDALIAPIYSRYENPSTTVLAGVGDLWVHLRARCRTGAEADALLGEVGDPIAALLGDRVYTTDAEEPLEQVVGNLLRKHKATVATAESCTGGLIATRLTEYPGSSDFFLASFVTYSDAQKAKLLGVKGELLAQCGAVSESVAAAMAEGARSRSGATYALSTTGFSGPDGGTEQNPVGTVYIGLASEDSTKVIRLHFGSDRYRHRLLSTQFALDMLRRKLL